jgi:polygalacturonase
MEASWPRIRPLPNYNTSEDGDFYLQYQSFLYAVDVHHIRIVGSGEIQGSGAWWWNAFANDQKTTATKNKLLQAGRPNLIQWLRCHHVELTGVTLRDSPFWCVHPVLSQHIHIHHMVIRARTYAPNSDGIDPDSSQHVLIEYNDVGCGDDHIAIKAGRCGDASSLVVGGGSNSQTATTGTTTLDRQYLHCATDPRFRNGDFETNNITIRYNLFRNGMGIAVGSESSGSIRNIDIYDNAIGVCQPGSDCVDNDSDDNDNDNSNDQCCGWGPGMHVKTTLSRGGILENISFRNNVVYNTTGFILLSSHYQTKEDSKPNGYDAVLVRNISFVGNRAFGSGKAATWDCSINDVCHDIQVVDNHVAVDPTDNHDNNNDNESKHNGTNNPWTCHFIDTFTVSGNYPHGLEECMEQSMNATATHWIPSLEEKRPAI